MTEYGYEPGQIHPELDVINPGPIPYSPRGRRRATRMEDPPDASWVKMVRLDHAHRGQIVPPSARGRAHKAWHECVVPPIEPEGTTWDCPDCGRVWIVAYYETGTLAGWLWTRASWRTARAHRKATR